MNRWTIKQLNEMTNLQFARAIIGERLNKVSNPYSPLASKLRSAANKLDELVAEEEVQPKPQPKQYMSHEDVFDDLGWNWHTYKDGTLELGKHSPAGEDFNFTIAGKDIPHEVAEYTEDFDVDEHVEFFVNGRGKHGIPDSIRTLVEDAEAIQKMLDELSEALKSVQPN